ncbi:MAG: HAD family hydrolase [Candidatus Hinthialibacter antarcticus]|nr:HAD family hydrolase [Candidatus Hinthialibacter antarcticus]
MKKPTLFLDRDGTLITDVGYPKSPDLVEPVPGAVEAMQTLAKMGYQLIVISNQSGVGRGIISPEEAKSVHDRFIELFKEQGIEFQDVYYCPHAPEEDCECRKPSPYMLYQADQDHGVDFSKSYMVGDRLGDVQTGKNAGCRAILFMSQYVDDPGDLPDAVVDGWEQALPILVKAWKENS